MSAETLKLEDFNRETRRKRFGQSNKNVPARLVRTDNVLYENLHLRFESVPSERAVKRVTAGRTR